MARITTGDARADANWYWLTDPHTVQVGAWMALVHASGRTQGIIIDIVILGIDIDHKPFTLAPATDVSFQLLFIDGLASDDNFVFEYFAGTAHPSFLLVVQFARIILHMTSPEVLKQQSYSS